VTKAVSDRADMSEVLVGLEIHQQLASEHKLFCQCPIVKSEELPLSFERRLRPAQSETGKLDPAAVFEFTRGKSNVYLWNPESSCLVEADEEPPHGMNEEALDIVLLISAILHSSVVDEVHVMRKIVIDGSNTTGFQRTAVVALGGFLEVEVLTKTMAIELREGGKKGERRGDDGSLKVGVQSVTIEEDAARIVGEDDSARRFALDRLGVPLVEVALEPIKGTPEDVGRVALALGRALRSTGKVARGLGTIRQDLNVSVGGGSVVEVKGVQKLNLVPKVVAYEVARQSGLLELASKLRAMGVQKIRCARFNAGPSLQTTNSRVIQGALKAGGIVICVSAEGLRGLMGWEPAPGIRLGKEVAEVARANGLGGIIHSDEFAKQGVTPAEEAALRRGLAVGDDAALVLLAGPVAKVEKAVPQVVTRLEQAAKGVPAETRSPTEDGESRYMRPRPGAQRMYPETDVKDIVIREGRLEHVKEGVPEGWDDAVARCAKSYFLSRDMAAKLLDSDYFGAFEPLVRQLGNLDPSLVASMLVDLPVRLMREGVPESALSQETIAELLHAIDSGEIAKEAAPDVLRSVGKGDSKTVEEAIKTLRLGALDESELYEIVESVVRENKGLIVTRGDVQAFSPLMGEVMAKVRGRADGKLVSKLLRERIAASFDFKSGAR